MKRSGYLAAAGRYLPLDELLDMPRVRVLRVLRRFDAMSMNDILDVLDDHEQRVTNALWRALAVLIKAGHVERTSIGRSHWYQITPTGRLELGRLLGRADIPEGEAVRP